MRMKKVAEVLDTGSGPNLVRKDILPLPWCDAVKPIKKKPTRCRFEPRPVFLIYTSPSSTPTKLKSNSLVRFRLKIGRPRPFGYLLHW